MNNKSMFYRKYEIMPQLMAPSQPAPSRWAGFSKLWNTLIHVLSQSHEPRIRQRVNSQGQPYWDCYDPQTQQSTYCFSEVEACIWIERLPLRLY